jgi:hypothetical protein
MAIACTGSRRPLGPRALHRQHPGAQAGAGVAGGGGTVRIGGRAVGRVEQRFALQGQRRRRRRVVEAPAQARARREVDGQSPKPLPVRGHRAVDRGQARDQQHALPVGIHGDGGQCVAHPGVPVSLLEELICVCEARRRLAERAHARPKQPRHQLRRQTLREAAAALDHLGVAVDGLDPAEPDPARLILLEMQRHDAEATAVMALACLARSPSQPPSPLPSR